MITNKRPSTTEPVTVMPLTGRGGPEFVLVRKGGGYRPAVFFDAETARAAAHLPDDVLASLQRVASRRGGRMVVTAADITEATAPAVTAPLAPLPGAD